MIELQEPQPDPIPKLGDLFDLVKGEIPTMKAVPGEYPLVVTGATRRSCDSYQFDCEAVCIPLVSSTGHGHASIHRLHYQKGKFALANIMVALKPKPKAPVHMRFLYYFLTGAKDQLLVPLMAGTSNVSLRISDLESVPICLPSISEQMRIADRIELSFERLSEALSLNTTIASDFERLVVAMTHREDLSEEKKRAAGWKRVRLGEVMTLDLDPVKVDPSDEYPNLGIFSFGKGLFHKPPISGLETSAPTLYRVKSGQFIYSRLFAFEGSYGFVSEEFDGKFVSGEYPTFTCDPSLCRAEFVYSYFKPKKVWETLSAKSKGLGLRRQRVQAPAILAHEVWLPPLSEQDRIAEVLRAKREYDALNTFEKDAEALRRSILANAFRGELV